LRSGRNSPAQSLVAADKREGNTLSDKKTEQASKILRISDNGLVTGWGLAALRSEVNVIDL
jgi:hypothetical protein